MCAVCSFDRLMISDVVLQVHLPGDLHGGDDHQVGGEGFHLEQVHVPAQPVELVGLCGDHVRLRHHRHGRGQSGGTAHFPRAPSPQDCLYHARSISHSTLYH